MPRGKVSGKETKGKKVLKKLFQKKSVEEPKEETVPTITEVALAKCDCGKEAVAYSHQCWDCSHRK